VTGLSLILLAFSSSLIIALALVLTERFHGRLSLDSPAGVQKLHAKPVPRIGGLALFGGYVAGGLTLPDGLQDLWVLAGFASLPAFLSGFAEDITKQVGACWRLGATIGAGVLYCLLGGQTLGGFGVPVLDGLLSLWWIGVPLTAVVIGGVANAFNIIDGVNGLSSGTAIIVLAGLAIVADRQNDAEILALCLVMIGALAGFLVLNYPLGLIFLGDAGAYLTGAIVAMVAVMLPLRHPELTPSMGLLALAYPVIEMLVSIRRRMNRNGTHPGRADRLHLHSLVFRDLARRLAGTIGVPASRSAVTATVLWGLPAVSVALMLATSDSGPATLSALALVLALYVVIYRRVALMRPFPPIRRRHA